MLIDIVPVGDVDPQIKRVASESLQSIYDCAVRIGASQSVPESAFDDSREQYRAEEFIELASRAGRGEKNIAITPADLYYRRRNYVFGLAYLDGDGSVISTHRLRTQADGGIATRSAESVFAERIRKEVVHEVGHNFGLEHCDNTRCVMSFSPTVKEIDRKDPALCGSCARQLD